MDLVEQKANIPSAIVRDVIMVSHANPEDDDLALWIATQLAANGYKVWCDKVQFLGGEQFWNDIDPVIRTKAGMVVYILSRTSNQMGHRGFIKELELALATERRLAREHGEQNPYKRFLIPIAKDDLPTNEYNIHLTGRNVVAFRSWAEGFVTLLQILEEAGFPKSESVSASDVSNWWRSYKSSTEGLVCESSELLSNVFPITRMPKVLFRHRVANLNDTARVKLNSCPFPYYQDGFDLYCFAKASELKGKLGEGVVIEDLGKGGRIPVKTVLAHDAHRDLRRLKPFIVAILRMAWENLVDGDERFAVFLMSQDKKCSFMKKPRDADHLIESFIFENKGSIRRKLVGGFGGKINDTADAPFKRYYHIGASASATLTPLAFRLIQHVIFTDDGLTPWSDAGRMHRYRRSFCSMWFNDRWRDSLLSFAHALAHGGKSISLQVSQSETVDVSVAPITYSSDIHFTRTAGTLLIDSEDEELDPDCSDDVDMLVDEEDFK